MGHRPHGRRRLGISLAPLRYLYSVRFNYRCIVGLCLLRSCHVITTRKIPMLDWMVLKSRNDVQLDLLRVMVSQPRTSRHSIHVSLGSNGASPRAIHANTSLTRMNWNA